MSELDRVPRLRLLAGIDLSERSRNAFSRAVQLAHSGGGALALVHVASDLTPPNLMAAHATFAGEFLQDQVRKAQAEGVRHVTHEIAHGREYEQLIERATKEPCDLIVLGRHRPSSVLQDMLGTTSSRVLRLAGIPVLVVQHKAEQAYNSVLVAVDFSPASRRALEYAMRWFPKARIEVVTAYVSPRGTRLLGEDSIRKSVAETRRLALKGFLAEVAQGLGPDYAKVAERVVAKVEHGWPEDVIQHEIEVTKPDLVVIGTHARSGVGHAVLGSVAEWVLIESPCDVLAVPPPHYVASAAGSSAGTAADTDVVGTSGRSARNA